MGNGGEGEEVLQHRHQQLKRLLHLSPSSLTCLHTLFNVINFRLVAHPNLKNGRAGEKSYSICSLKLSSISIFISYFLSRLSSLRSFHFISMLFAHFSIFYFVNESFCSPFLHMLCPFPLFTLSLSSVFLLHPFFAALLVWLHRFVSFCLVSFFYFSEVFSYLCTGYITFNEFFYCFVNRVESCFGIGESRTVQGRGGNLTFLIADKGSKRERETEQRNISLLLKLVSYLIFCIFNKKPARVSLI